MIVLIFCGDLKYCPYLKRYTERLEKSGLRYEVWYWNRGSFSYDYGDNYFCYNRPSPENLNKVRKIKDFLGFRRWLIRQMKKKNPSKLILLSTLTGILLFDKLKGISYIFDIRDYSYEHFLLFRILEKKVIDNSNFTAISSVEFKNFLPKGDYIIAHNFNRKEIPNISKFERKSLPLNFVWNGTVRYLKFQKQYIMSLKNDSRFKMVYHGNGTELDSFKKFCKDNNVKNVIFTGSYDNKDKYELLKNAAILNNCYGGEKDSVLNHSIPNRFYDGIIFRIPQIVEPESYKEILVENNKIGKSRRAQDGFADWLFDYYMSINGDDFESSCQSVLNKILVEDDKYIEYIDLFIN